MYGIKESPPSIPKAICLNHDLENLRQALSSVDSSINTSCIQDFYRLGKFNASNLKPHPILVKFLRTFDATLVLSKRGSLPSSINIKPDLTRLRRKSSVFLRTRWNLTQSGTNKKFIKLRGSNIYVNKLLYAKSDDGSIVRNVINSSLSSLSLTEESSHSDSNQMLSPPNQHTATSNPEPMTTTTSSTPNNNQ